MGRPRSSLSNPYGHQKNKSQSPIPGKHHVFYRAWGQSIGGGRWKWLKRPHGSHIVEVALVIIGVLVDTIEVLKPSFIVAAFRRTPIPVRQKTSFGSLFLGSCTAG
jgi:hypothetical protein